MTGHTFHIAQAKHNKNFLDMIAKTNFFDWRATVMFYTALHYTDFYFDSLLKLHPEDHQDRFRLLQNNNKQFSQNFFYSFKHLYNMSMMARYFPDAWQKTIDEPMMTTLEKELTIVMGKK